MNKIFTSDFGLIGHPLVHSFSEKFFATFFEMNGLPFKYENFDIPELTPESLYNVVMLNDKLKGFNVTAPYKQQILEYLDSTNELAKRVSAVNTVKVLRDGSGRVTALKGYNTDVTGFTKALTSFLGGNRPDGALILGTGGAAKAVAVALEDMGIPHLFISRTKTGNNIKSYSDIDSALLRSYSLIINATPAGTYPNIHSCPALPYGLLTKSNICFDLVYNPETTEFMRRAASQGAAVQNGLEMLFTQAMESFKIWLE